MAKANDKLKQKSMQELKNQIVAQQLEHGGDFQTTVHRDADGNVIDQQAAKRGQSKADLDIEQKNKDALKVWGLGFVQREQAYREKRK